MKNYLQPLALLLALLAGIQSSPAPVALGNLQVNILPPAAVAAGALWQADGGALQTNGATLLVITGGHTVSFTNVSGWITPGNLLVTVFAGQTTTTNGTYVAVAAPVLTVTRTPTNTVLVSWPSPATGFNLQVNTNLATTNWVTPAETVQTNGANKFILVNPPAGNRFYRLKNP